MSAKALSRNLHIPVATHPDTGEPLTLHTFLQSDIAFTRPEDLPTDAQIEFLENAWRKGLWRGDVVADTSEPLSLNDAIAEIRNGTELGAVLHKAGLRAIEMLREMARGEGGE